MVLVIVDVPLRKGQQKAVVAVKLAENLDDVLFNFKTYWTFSILYLRCINSFSNGFFDVAFRFVFFLSRISLPLQK